MADTTKLKKFDLECPYCDEDFELTLDPAALIESEDTITCPACAEECEWDLDDVTGELVLLLSDEDDEDEDDEDEEDQDDDE